MKYRIVVQPRALRDLERIYESMAALSRESANAWFQSIDDSIASLAKLPERFALAPESQILGAPIRQFVHGKRNSAYRVLYTVRAQEVHVLHVRHAAREFFDADSFFAE